MKVKNFYRGFTTRNYRQNGSSFEIFDVNCVEEDLLNEILTIKGERVHMPNYGTRIPLMTFEINDAESYDIIKEDIISVIDHDPRVELESLDVISSPDKNSLIAIVKINYLQFEVTRDLYIEINSQ